MVLLLSCLLLGPVLSGTARAEEPVELIDVRRLSPTEYNDLLFDAQYALIQEIYRSTDAMVASNDEAAFRAWVEDGSTATRQALEHLETVPPYRGDGEFRDALEESYRWMNQMFTQTMPRVWELNTKERVRSADVATLEALWKEMDAQATATDTKVAETQKRFASKHGYGLLQEELPELTADSMPEFTSAGFPPEGSALGAEEHVGFAVRYHNEMLASQGQVMDALNAFMVGTGGDTAKLEGLRVDAIKRIQAEVAHVEEMGDWLGDTSFQAAALGFYKALLTQLDGGMKEYTAVAVKPRKKNKDIDLMNARAQASQVAVEEGLAAFDAAMRQYQITWRIAEYEAWTKTLPQ